MKITEDQRKIINSLICERLSSMPENMWAVGDFWNSRNDNIAKTLRDEAFGEDEKGVVAYYVVKHPRNGKILLFFSLKCGMLYDEFINDKNLAAYKKLIRSIEEISLRDDLTDEELAILEMLKEKMRSHKGLAKADINAIPKRGREIVNDLEREMNANITHVGATFSGVELVHFCVNEGTRSDWEELGIGQKLGIVAFWQFIVQKVLECRQLVGCQYLYLFAADNTEDEMLVSYYRNLRFLDSVERATVKPLYDLTCKFMYQEICELPQLRENFFDNFNPDVDAV